MLTFKNLKIYFMQEEVSGFDRKKSMGGLDETEESMLVTKKKVEVFMIIKKF